MKKSLLVAVLSLVIAGGCVGAGASNATSRVEVLFVDPEKFTDAKSESFDSEQGRKQILDTLRSHVEQLARSYVSEGQHLVVRFTDIDLAGDFEPWQGPQFSDIRILRDIYPPRMTVEFRLTGADGKVVSEGKRELQDLGYLMHLSMPTSDGLRYDKELLSDWMRREFRRSA